MTPSIAANTASAMDTDGNHGSSKRLQQGTDDQHHPEKRSKLQNSGGGVDLAAEVIRHDLLAPATVEALRDSYNSSQPYLHVVIKEVLDLDLLRRVREECLTALHATEKETDIYRVFQTGDLANLDGLPADELAQLASLKRLRDALYSDTFRALVERVCGVNRLSPSKKDLSVNIYRSGCHLICHDDVIGSRSVSYIFYLTDPDEPWRPEEGGALELYPVVSKGTPAVDPTVAINPEFGQLAMFAVQPGLSFHSVSEVVAREGRDRLSISGWFHVLQPEDMTEEEASAAAAASGDAEDKAKASLDQLTEGDSSRPFVPIDTSADNCSVWFDESGEDLFLSANEIEELRPYINPRYLDPKIISLANQSFCNESSIQLTSFLNDEYAEKIRQSINEEDRRCGFLNSDDENASQSVAPQLADYEKGIVTASNSAPMWSAHGPAHMCRFLEMTGKVTDERDEKKDPTVVPARQLAPLRDHIFPRSRAFHHLLHLITSLTVNSSRGLVRRFRPGMDYTLATSTPVLSSDVCGSSGQKLSTSILDASLCFVADDTASRAEAWSSDEHGGFECFMAADEGNEDPAQYRSAATGDGGALLSVSAAFNTLTLVMRDAGVMKFVKYVGARAPGCRWDVSWEYRFVDEDEDEMDE